MTSLTVINENNKDRYTVSSYNLKVLKCNLPDLATVDSGVVHKGFKSFDDIEAHEKEEYEKEHPTEKEVPVGNDLEPVVNESHDELIESLLKKADDLSGKYLKAQMDLETFQEESTVKEDAIREAAFKEGQASATEEASANAEQLQSGVLKQLQTSIETLQQHSTEFEKALQSVKEELVSAALAIAKEVIVTELDAHANQIALNLASSLIEDIDKRSDITLKVHPNQLSTFSKALVGESHINIVADGAVSEGGVIILSQIGTIEADIMKRFEHIKRSTLNQ